jgi:hypothetical protein
MQKVPRAYLRIIRGRIAESTKEAGAAPGARERKEESE